MYGMIYVYIHMYICICIRIYTHDFGRRAGQVPGRGRVRRVSGRPARKKIISMFVLKQNNRK